MPTDQEQVPQEELITPEQESADFAAGFSNVRSDEMPPEQEQKEAAQEPTEPPPAEVETSGETQEEAKALIAGLTEDQIRTLLEKAARVDDIEKEIRKVHGKLGEFGGTIKKITESKPEPVKASPEVDPEISQFQQDYPEFASVAQKIAEKIVADKFSASTEAQPPQPAEEEQPGTQIDSTTAMQMAVMDTLRPTWKQDIASNDFRLWIATQPENVRKTFETTTSAQELLPIISSYADRANAIKAQAEKSKQRLEQAVLPSSRAKTTHVPSDTDLFEAGFRQVRGR